jgi:hypothetical protein
MTLPPWFEQSLSQLLKEEYLRGLRDGKLSTPPTKDEENTHEQ